MRQVLQERLKTRHGWPRRIAALACLLLAAASALGTPDAQGGATRPPPLAGKLLPGQVLVPVTLAGQADFLREGDRVDLLAAAPDTATATEVGTGLVVVRVTSPAASVMASQDGTRLLVAASRPAAARIAAVPPGQIVAVLDNYP